MRPLFALLALASCAAAADPPKLLAVTPDRTALPAYDRIELAVDLVASYTNPFDPEQVAVDADFTAPDGTRSTVPGFWWSDAQSKLANGREVVTLTGEPGWRVRFTPTAAGDWSVVVRVKDAGGEARAAAVKFTATPAAAPGFVRAAGTYFRYDDGNGYYPLGENMGWAGPRGTADFGDWLSALGAAGGNWMRIWMSSWHTGLEWSAEARGTWSTGGFGGLGTYNLANAWKLDTILAQAARAGVKAMVCFGTYGEFKEGGFFNEGQWKANPYNAAVGGPCAQPADFWTDATARRLYQRRLRYILARWGYSPQVFAWEFWNEADAPTPWIAEMAAWVKSHDVHRHLVSTTYGQDAIWKLPEIDFTMTHHYGMGNTADFTAEFVGNARSHRRYGKPHIAAEFGIDWRKSDQAYDPQGTGQALHNALWAGLAGGDGGAPMTWWWDNYIHPRKLYPHFTPVARYTAGLDWAAAKLAPVDGVTVERAVGTAAVETFGEVRIGVVGNWGRPGSGHYTVGRDGQVAGGDVPTFLGSVKRGGDGHELHSTLTFEVDVPAKASFIARVGTVSTHARLRLAVDGATAFEQTYDAGPAGQGKYKSTKYDTQWKIWQSEFDADAVVAVPAGRHTVTVTNVEGDWLTVAGYRLTGSRSSRYPAVQALAVAGTDLALVWIHDQASTWLSAREQVKLAPQTDLRVGLPRLTGRWQVSWFDTYRGEVVGTETITATDGRLVLAVPEFSRDLAAKLTR